MSNYFCYLFFALCTSFLSPVFIRSILFYFILYVILSFLFFCAGADVFSPYLGEAEAAVRQAFLLARNAAPALLFFDEIDAIVCKREAGAQVKQHKIVLKG